MKTLIARSILICFAGNLAQGASFVPEYEVISRHVDYEERLYSELKWVTIRYNDSDEEAFHQLNNGSFGKLKNPLLLGGRQPKHHLALVFRKTCQLTEKEEKCSNFSAALPSSVDVQLTPNMEIVHEEPTIYYVRNFCRVFGILDPFNVFKVADLLSEGITEYSGDGDFNDLSSLSYHYVTNLQDYEKPNFKPFCEIWVKREKAKPPYILN